jgi:hypothetical protein
MPNYAGAGFARGQCPAAGMAVCRETSAGMPPCVMLPQGMQRPMGSSLAAPVYLGRRSPGEKLQATRFYLAALRGVSAYAEAYQNSDQRLPSNLASLLQLTSATCCLEAETPTSRRYVRGHQRGSVERISKKMTSRLAYCNQCRSTRRGC